MQSENRFIDDLTRMMSGAMSAAGGVREEAEARMRQHFEGLFARMDLVRREEFNDVRDMAALARQENERLAARVADVDRGTGGHGRHAVCGAAHQARLQQPRVHVL